MIHLALWLASALFLLSVAVGAVALVVYVIARLTAPKYGVAPEEHARRMRDGWAVFIIVGAGLLALVAGLIFGPHR